MYRTRASRFASRTPPSAIRAPQLVMLGLLLVTAGFYVRALGFGFIWDDPLWYGRVVGKSLLGLIQPMPDYHFYRPVLVLYNRLFLRPDHTFVAPALHAAQIGWHLVNVALTFALSRRLGLKGWSAVIVAGLAAWCPLSHQAVAWAAPAQPLALALQNGAWLAYLEVRRRQAGRSVAAAVSLALFLVALGVQEGGAALGFLPLLTELLLYRQRPCGEGWQLVLAYPLVGAGYGLLWLRLPHQAGYTTLALQGPVAMYFLQGLIFPLLGRPAGYAPGQTVAPGVLLALAGLALAGLLLAARRAGRGRQALLGLGWALLGIAPSAVGLRYSYVKVGSRLFYYAVPGMALLWTCALFPPARRTLARRVWRGVGALLLSLIALQSGLLLTRFQHMYAVGTTHLNELVQTARTADARMLFVNFPDRYAPKRPPYPLGYWGVTLAPVSVDLGAFPAVVVGHHPTTASRGMPGIDAEARDAGPYRIDLRGVITPPDQLYRLARQMDAVYLSRHHPDGTFTLHWAGAVTATLPVPHPDPATACQLAVFSQTLCLQAVQVERQPGQLALELTWLSLSSARPHDTIFVHLGRADQPPIAQADGDAWLGMLPLTIWQPGDAIQERRTIVVPEGAPPDLRVMVGVYNRVTGERLPATTPQGEALPHDGFRISLASNAKMP